MPTTPTAFQVAVPGTSPGTTAEIVLQVRSTVAGVVATVCHMPSTDDISVTVAVRLSSTTMYSSPSALPGNIVHSPPGTVAAPVALFWSVSNPTPTAAS